ncbi:MAG: asparaginase [Rhodospirillales bacterium]|jgi:L-asparaginase II|nr:asparaginase [Rhodospirillales bacterium]MDP6773503.1 asparaginase [Rhodospirillales bacterium]
MDKASPVLVEVTRGEAVESHHRGVVAVADAGGAIVAAWGDTERAVYPRSAIKPLQALPLIETGAAEGFALGDAEIALACASHNGEAEHVAGIAAWLERVSLAADDLECGAQSPLGREAALARVRAGDAPSALTNTCSGKHAGFLTTALHLGEETAGYIKRGHAVQRRVAETLAEMTGCDVATAPVAIDGCGIPTFAVPLAAVARAMARLAAPDSLAPPRAAAARRIVAAMTAHPGLVAGRGRYDTAVMEAGRGAFVVKSGAEGFHAAIMPGLGLGCALKIEDGAGRAAEVAMTAVLRHLGVLDDHARTEMVDYLERPLVNWSGKRVGVIRATLGS